MTLLAGRIPVYLNDRDLVTLGTDLGVTVRVEKITGVTGVAVVDQLPTLGARGRLGQTIVGDHAAASAGQCAFSLRVDASTLTLLRSSLEFLAAWLIQGSTRIRTGYALNRQAKGRGTASVSEYDYPGNAQGRIDVTYTIDHALWFETTPQIIAMSHSIAGVGQRLALPLGNAPSDPVITVYGPSTSPINLIYRDSQGNIVSTLTLAVSLGSTEYLTIDANLKTITKTTAGVDGTIAAGLALINNATGPLYPSFDPEDGDRYGAVCPTLELTDAGNTATAVVRYVRGYR